MIFFKKSIIFSQDDRSVPRSHYEQNIIELFKFKNLDLASSPSKGDVARTEALIYWFSNPKSLNSRAQMESIFDEQLRAQRRVTGEAADSKLGNNDVIPNNFEKLKSKINALESDIKEDKLKAAENHPRLKDYKKEIDEYRNKVNEFKKLKELADKANQNDDLVLSVAKADELLKWFKEHYAEYNRYFKKLMAQPESHRSKSQQKVEELRNRKADDKSLKQSLADSKVVEEEKAANQRRDKSNKWKANRKAREDEAQREEEQVRAHKQNLGFYAPDPKSKNKAAVNAGSFGNRGKKSSALFQQPGSLSMPGNSSQSVNKKPPSPKAPGGPSFQRE